MLALGSAAAGSLMLRAKGQDQKAKRSSAVSLRAFENELGVQEPVGFWDPAGFTADGSAENFARRRQTELSLRDAYRVSAMSTRQR